MGDYYGRYALTQTNSAIQQQSVQTLPAPNPIKSECAHDYRVYAGFVEAYEYCDKCDHKKPIETNQNETVG